MGRHRVVAALVGSSEQTRSYRAKDDTGKPLWPIYEASLPFGVGWTDRSGFLLLCPAARSPPSQSLHWPWKQHSIGCLTLEVTKVTRAVRGKPEGQGTLETPGGRPGFRRGGNSICVPGHMPSPQCWFCPCLALPQSCGVEGVTL